MLVLVALVERTLLIWRTSGAAIGQLHSQLSQAKLWQIEQSSGERLSRAPVIGTRLGVSPAEDPASGY